MHAGVPIITEEIQIVDHKGRQRLLLSAKSGNPVIVLSAPDGRATLHVLLDEAGRPAVTLANPQPQGPTAALAVDDKGVHVKFDRPGGASSYLFLNNAGTSGVVLIDPHGVRRLNVLLGPDGGPKIERFDAAGKPLPGQ